MADTHIEFPEPCHEDWDAMRPAGRARHCASCDQPVHDLTAYTPEEADALIHGAAGPACLRAHIAADGRVLTKPSPTGKRLTAALPALFIALASTGAAADPATGAVSGWVKAGRTAPLTVTAIAPGVRRSAQVDTSGAYRLEHLPPGAYRLEFKVRKAVWWAVDGVTVRANYVTVRKADMPPPSPPLPPPRETLVLVTGGLPVSVPPPETSNAPAVAPPPAPPENSPSPVATAPAQASPPVEEVIVTAGKVATVRHETSPVHVVAIRTR